MNFQNQSLQHYPLQNQSRPGQNINHDLQMSPFSDIQNFMAKQMQSFFNFNNIEDDFDMFSNMHQGLHSYNGQGNSNGQPFQMYSQCFVSSSKMGPDGQIIEEKYFDNNHAARGADGNTISQRKQAYKNSAGVDKVAHERMVNDQGRKMIKNRNRDGQIEEYEHFYNLQDHEKPQFDQNFDRQRQQMGIEFKQANAIENQFNNYQLGRNNQQPALTNNQNSNYNYNPPRPQVHPIQNQTQPRPYNAQGSYNSNSTNYRQQAPVNYAHPSYNGQFRQQPSYGYPK